MTIFDDLASEYGLRFPQHLTPVPPPPPGMGDTQQIPAVGVVPPPPYATWGPPPPASPPPVGYRPRPPQGLPPGCPACAERDRPWVLVHRHLDQLHAWLAQQLYELEQHMSAALDNANAQVQSLTQVVTQVAIPTLQHLAQLVAQGGSGIAESDVQAIADNVSSVVSQLAAAAQAAASSAPAA